MYNMPKSSRDKISGYILKFNLFGCKLQLGDHKATKLSAVKVDSNDFKLFTLQN